MSYESKVEQIYANEILLTSKSGTNVNIKCSTGEVLINGTDPSGGGASLPLIGTGNIEVVGDISAEGNITASATGPGQGLLTAATANISSDLTITGNGNLRLNGTGTIQLANTVSCGGIISSGDINTTANHDIVCGRNIYFEGQDIYHRAVTGFPPQVVNTPYVNYKQLVQLNAANTFTGANKFNNNVTEFADKVSVGTRDVGGLFTQNLALNTSGNIESKTINNNTTIQCGNINCGNGGTNSCAAKTFTTRTSGLAGWKMEQVVPSVPPTSFDNILNFRAGQVGGYVTITDSVEAPGVPNIILDPKTKAIGGLIKTTTFEVGQSGIAYKLTQPTTGLNTDNLLIKAAVAASEVIFQDNADAPIMTVKKTEVQLGNSIPILFGNYIFRPQQYSRNITLTIDGTKDTTNFTNMIFNPRDNPSDWTNVNTGAINQTIYNAALAGYYKCTATQTAISSASNYDGIKVIFDYVLEFSQQTSPDIEPPISYGYKVKPSGGQPPTIDVDHTNNPAQSQPVFLLFPNQNAGETMAMTVKLTKMDF